MADDWLSPENRVISVRVECKTAGGLLDAAHSFARSLRQLHGEGYDVKHIEVLAHCLRNDHYIEPKQELRIMSGEGGRLGSKRRVEVK